MSCSRKVKTTISRCQRCNASLVIPPDAAAIVAAICVDCSQDNGDDIRACFPRALGRRPVAA